MPKLNRKTLLSHLTEVDGFLRDDEALLLYDLAKTNKSSGVIVEIGSWKGKSTICLASATNSTVYAIDPHTGSPEHRKKMGKVDTYQDFLTNIRHAKLSQKVKPLRLTSKQAITKINEPISLLFIDGDHSYKSVLQDFKLYYPKLNLGGIIAFHDTVSWPGPRQVVTQHLYLGNHFKNIHLLGSITYAERVAHLTLIDRGKNYYAFLLRLVRNIFAVIPTPKPIREFLKTLFQKLQ